MKKEIAENLTIKFFENHMNKKEVQSKAIALYVKKHHPKIFKLHKDLKCFTTNLRKHLIDSKKIKTHPEKIIGSNDKESVWVVNPFLNGNQPIATFDPKKLVKSRSAEYGDAHLNHEEVMAALYPNGINLKTKQHQALYHYVDWVVSKLNRITNCQIKNDKVHLDSIKDIAGYAVLAVNRFEKNKNLK